MPGAFTHLGLALLPWQRNIGWIVHILFPIMGFPAPAEEQQDILILDRCFLSAIGRYLILQLVLKNIQLSIIYLFQH